MNTNVGPIVTAAVRHAKEHNSLVWTDELAHRIAASSPLPLGADDVAEQITTEATRQGAAVMLPPNR